MNICPIDINLNDARASSEELTENINNSLLSVMSLVTGYKLGKFHEYLISIISDITMIKCVQLSSVLA